MTTNHLPSERWTPPYPTQTSPRSRTWPAVTLAPDAALLSAAALIVALTRPPSSSPAAAPATTAQPTYTPVEVAAAHRRVCDVYNKAARAVQIETNGENPALAGVAAINGAVMLEAAVNAALALASGDRAAALALADAYSNTTAMSSIASGQNDPAWRAALDDVNAKDAKMKAMCSGG
ncbi:hypothetical protein C3469_26050 [Mycobacterium kansasii]|nr:hypothetical protein C3B43_27775 [Mycobacterium kansasii]POX94838.1 hypothetical protein C3477_26655 [Mycobacterium kansasii]POY12150.1 hypothetical protein C3476_28020 [Mycobacterium kansasii]POY19635.1 hypothetical protein C3469_26050 [Mycobacterium kansasii]POY31307.1 hypothetical protein C3478_17415 [Mycobacterium kansasii]